MCENLKPRRSKGDLRGSKVNQPDRVSLLSSWLSWFLGWLAKGIRFSYVDRAHYGKKRAPSVANVRTSVNYDN
jgi:hypothetical protein